VSETAIRARITGRVQGVSFRAWTKGRAEALGLEGWVRNEVDGSVTALFGGAPEAVAQMARALKEGPRWARVDRVETAPADIADIPPGFRITQ